MANKPQDNFTCGKSLAENGEYIGMSLKISIPSWFSALLSNPQMFSPKPLVFLDILCNSVMKSKYACIKDIPSADFKYEVLWTVQVGRPRIHSFTIAGKKLISLLDEESDVFLTTHSAWSMVLSEAMSAGPSSLAHFFGTL